MSSFKQHNVFKIYLCCNLCQYSIPFYGQITLHCVDRSHFLSTCSPADKHLGYFHVLDIMNTDSIKIQVHVFGCTRVLNSPGYNLGVDLLDHMVPLPFNILKNDHTVFQSI